MAIGKTSSTPIPTIDKTELLQSLRETDILSSMLPEVKTVPCKISSPFREDRNPSFSLFIGQGNHICFKDFGTGEGGDLISLYCKFWNCSYREGMERLYTSMPSSATSTGKPAKSKIILRKGKLVDIKVKVRPWQDYDYEYWASYGVDKKILKKANIYPISYYTITKKETPKSKGETALFNADKYAYVFVEKKDRKVSLKIYQPYNITGGKWFSQMDRSIWSLWTTIPDTGDNLVIGSSVKDCLNITCQLGLPAICMQGEGYLPKPQVMQELKDRFRNIIVFYDNDYAQGENNPGRKDSLKLAKLYNLKRVEIPQEYEAKDVSDLYKKYGREEYLSIMNTLLDPLLYKPENQSL